MDQFALKSLEKVLLIKKEYKGEKKTIIDLKWLSLAEFLYAKSLYRISLIEGIEPNEQVVLLFEALKYIVKSNDKALKYGNKKFLL
jgi:hypothetical protein